VSVFELCEKDNALKSKIEHNSERVMMLFHFKFSTVNEFTTKRLTCQILGCSSNTGLPVSPLVIM